MSGGGKPKKGGMGHQMKDDYSEEYITGLQKESTELIERIDEVRKEKMEIDRKIQELLRDEAQAKKEKQRIEMDIEF